MAKMANFFCGGTEKSPVSIVFNLFCKSFSTLLQHLRHMKTVEPCNVLYEHASETSGIPSYNLIVHYSSFPNYYDDPETFSPFSITRDLLKTQGKFLLYFIFRSLYLPLAVVLC